MRVRIRGKGFLGKEVAHIEGNSGKICFTTDSLEIEASGKEWRDAIKALDQRRPSIRNVEIIDDDDDPCLFREKYWGMLNHQARLSSYRKFFQRRIRFERTDTRVYTWSCSYKDFTTALALLEQPAVTIAVNGDFVSV